MHGVAYFGAVVQKMTRSFGIEHDCRRDVETVSCQWCGEQVRLCQPCDRGQRYCGNECASARRQAAQRAASAAYQRTDRGAHLHADRMQRYRDRQRSGEYKFLKKKLVSRICG
jgi:hypothetical protein